MAVLDSLSEKAYKRAVEFMIGQINQWVGYGGDNKYRLQRIKSSWAYVSGDGVSVNIEANDTEKVKVEFFKVTGGVFYFSTNKVFDEALLISGGQEPLF